MWKRVLCLLLAMLLLIPAAGAAEVEVEAPSAVLMEADSGKILFEKFITCTSFNRIITAEYFA